jgi:hypothetical protein
MARACYRGVWYDTETPKKDFIEWHKNVDTKEHSYRGNHYHPIQTMDTETKSYLYKGVI